MHIPDGYLSPQTYVAAYGLTAPFWATASRRLKKTLKSRQVPLLALSAAFCFVIMMFNIPIPGGTTGHAIGGVLTAILLGPWAACIVVSVAVIIQAFIFGDGGITCIGANCLTMAVVMPFTGYAAYWLIAGRSNPSSRLRWIGAALGGYIGLNMSALATAFLLGAQPMFFLDSSGCPLYAPFPLGIAVPLMAFTHLTVFGLVEAAVTGLVVAYMQRTEPSLLYAAAGASDRAGRICLQKGSGRDPIITAEVTGE